MAGGRQIGRRIDPADFSSAGEQERTSNLQRISVMKKHYDFTNAMQGKLYRPAASLRIPVYLDADVRRKLLGAAKRRRNVSKLVNSILRSQIGVLELLK